MLRVSLNVSALDFNIKLLQPGAEEMQHSALLQSRFLCTNISNSNEKDSKHSNKANFFCYGYGNKTPSCFSATGAENSSLEQIMLLRV